jgi:hypothetical protein
VNAIRIALALPAGLLVLLGALTAGAGASPGASAAAAGTATFTDPAGDAQGGPDVTQAVVSGDAATGLVTFAVTVPGHLPAVPDAYERNALVWIDADMNGATGDPDDGADYLLVAWNDPSGRWWNISRWSGGEWQSAPESPSMRFTRVGDTLRWTLSTTDLGGAAAFRFYVIAGTWDLAARQWLARDDAPDAGWWSYNIAAPSSPTPPTTPATPAAPKVNLLVGAPQAAPKTPRAGRTFTVGFPVRVQTEKTVTSVDLQTGETREALVVTWTPASGGTMTCTASAGRKVPVRCGSFKGDVARVSLVVPKNAAGKVLKLTVRITAKDKETGKTVTASRVVSFRVK